MTALVTGASSGIGRDIARELERRGARLILTGRNTDALEALRDEFGKNRAKIFAADLSKTSECRRLYEFARGYDIDILINNAGFGLFGKFSETDLDRELEMIDVNVKSVHMLTKLFLRDFISKDSGYILNVASAAGFMPGPYMAAYYSTKNYVVSLTQALCEELRHDKSSVYVGALCPGPVHTNFDDTAGVSFSLNGISSGYAAKCAVDGMFRRRHIIVPSAVMKAAVAGADIVPSFITAKFARMSQSRKGDIK